MIDYEVSVQPTAISRNWDEDADPHEEGYLPAAPAVEAKLLLVSGDGDGRGAGAPPPPPKPVRARNLVVGLRGAGALFVEQCLLGGGGGNGAPPPVGALVLPAPGGRAAATVEEAAEEPETALLHRAAADSNTLLLAVHYEVAAESARGWAMALLGGLEVERCVVLDSVMSHSFYTAEVDAPVPPALFKLECGAPCHLPSMCALCCHCLSCPCGLDGGGVRVVCICGVGRPAAVGSRWLPL
jgi:hypothetical protein